MRLPLWSWLGMSKNEWPFSWMIWQTPVELCAMLLKSKAIMAYASTFLVNEGKTYIGLCVYVFCCFLCNCLDFCFGQCLLCRRVTHRSMLSVMFSCQPAKQLALQKLLILDSYLQNVSEKYAIPAILKGTIDLCHLILPSMACTLVEITRSAESKTCWLCFLTHSKNFNFGIFVRLVY